MLWFAWKFVPLWYQQQHETIWRPHVGVVICLKIRTFVVSATTDAHTYGWPELLWFAWKFVPLWYQQQLSSSLRLSKTSCDLLENSYLCGISNNFAINRIRARAVVICLKIRTFVVSATTSVVRLEYHSKLWFAWKFVPLWYQQQPLARLIVCPDSCDLLENSYLCGISNNRTPPTKLPELVVICLKIRTFVVSATTLLNPLPVPPRLWFAWKFVPLWYQQQHWRAEKSADRSCDLLENSYLCGISNNYTSNLPKKK